MLTGCTSFAGKLPPIYTYEQIPHVEQKRAVSYEAEFFRFTGERDPRLTRKLEQEVKRVFLKSGAFSSVDTARSAEANHLLIKIETKAKNELLGAINGIITTLTLFIIPGYTREEMTMTVEVYWRNSPTGNISIRQYIYKDRLDIWAHISLLLLMPIHSHEEGERDLMEHLLLKFVHDISADQVSVRERN
jgi:hypothetical protein